MIICLTVSACQSLEGGEAREYEIKGQVISVDKRARQAIISHEPVPDFMEAMTMPFTIKEEWALNELAAGDRIQATLVVQEERSWLERIVIVRSEPESEGAVEGLEPTPGVEIPAFTLTNQDGRRIRLDHFRGRAVVLTFIYTRCPLPDYCPLMTGNFESIHRALGDDPALDKTVLLSVSVDPEYDTPAVLRQYGAEHTSGRFDRWQFVTGSAEEVKGMAGFFGLQYATEGDQIIHSLRTALISPDGKLHRLYRGNEWKPGEVVRDLRGLAAAETADER